MEAKNVVIQNKLGMHARPAQIFAKEAAQFSSKITITKGERKASGKSVINIIALGLVKGTEITVSAEGDDEKEAVKTLVDLINSKFGEE
ncbi:HPr family phosphocarrier protein [Clostridium thermarum]|uniref:HPr family phosphocarrier protein n=1 Tax=Clostridium thermarum TaxID=1716543 RepID=UPI001121A58C|nr:HPr family phosphocarrier protein [Clostridium thermarum]